MQRIYQMAEQVLVVKRLKRRNPLQKNQKKKKQRERVKLKKEKKMKEKKKRRSQPMSKMKLSHSMPLLESRFLN